MMETEQDTLKAQIEEEANNSLSETMWGGYANDIITGIANNGSVKPNRAIWELVQNARDVSLEGGKSRIVFKRQKDSFVFQHNGQPFDRKSLQSLILQTSSKVRQDIIQVGQYGTGFLTTHKFGLKFRLSGALQLLSGQDKYYNFDESELLLNRSSNDKKLLSGWLNSQILTTQQWGSSNLSRITDTPKPLTTFTYLHDYPIERSNVAEAFETSPVLVPYVLALNPYVESITFIDETEEDKPQAESFCFSEEKTDCEFGDCVVAEVVIKHSKTGQSDESMSVFLLQSRTKKEEKTGESVVTVILPLKRIDDKKAVIELSEITPQLFLYLPLLGTTEWGWNFILHAPSFTCDQDSRDRLLLVGNGQNNDNQAEKNRELINNAKCLIQEYLNREYKNFVDVKHLCKVDFNMSQPSQKLADYYKQLQSIWVDYFEGLELVDNKDKTAKITVRSIRVLNKELYEACEDDTELLDALYALLSKQEHNLTLPCKEDLVYWSRITDEWYSGRENRHILSMDTIVELIKDTAILQADLEWLHKLCVYFKENNHADYFKNNAILPNEDLTLRVLKELKKPAYINGTLRNALKILLPETVKSFVHANFVDIVDDGVEVYDDSKIKESLAGYLTGLPNKAKELKNAIIAKQSINPAQYENVLLSAANIQAILDLYKMCLSENATGFVPNIFNLLCEIYAYFPTTTERISKEVLDVRGCYRVLICDSLFKFTLDTNKASKRDWCFNMTKELKTFSDANDFLREYQIYPNQVGAFRYAEQLKKEEEGIPERLKEIYDVICRGVTEAETSRSIKHELVCKEFAPYFIGESKISGKNIADEIDSPFSGENKRLSIEGAHKKLYLEIIKNITDKDKRLIWEPLFTAISSARAILMMSVVTSPSKKESIFKIVGVEDEAKLHAIAELSEQDNIEDVVKLGKDALAQQQDAEYKNMLGNYVESHLLVFLREKLSPLGVIVENQQGGQDFILSKEGHEDYFVEVKSRWENDQSVLMSNVQFHKAVGNADRYALISVNMYHYDKKKAENNEPLILEDISDNIKILDNIGHLEKDLQEKVDDVFNRPTTDICVEGTYGVRVPQSIFNEYPLNLDGFIVKLKDYFGLLLSDKSIFR